jgi:hypothetical protein
MNAPVILTKPKPPPETLDPSVAGHPSDWRHNLTVSTKLPKGVIAIGMAGYAGILLAFWVAFGGDFDSAFVLVIVSLFALMFFGLPVLMSRTATNDNAPGERPQSLSEFLAKDFDTFTGRVSGWSALMQYAFLPLALAVGALTIGIILLFLR